MSKPALAAVLLVALLGAAAFFLLGGEGPAEPPQPQAPANAAPAGTTGTTGTATGGAVEAGAEQGQGTGERTQVAAGTGVDAAGPSLIGQVVDPQGAPVQGAEVQCTVGPDFRGGFSGTSGNNPDSNGRGRGNRGNRADRGNPGNQAPAFDWEELAGMDPEALVERFRPRPEQRTTVLTDAQGRFRLPMAGGGGTGFLRVLARGHQVLDRAVQRPADADADLGVLELRAGAVVQGRVVDQAGQPVVGARVSRVAVRGGNPMDPFGAFGGMPGFGGGNRGERGQRGMAGMADAFGAFGDLELPGMDVMEDLIAGDDGRTDEQGRFELSHVAPGSFALRARHPDHPPARREGMSIDGGQVLADIVVTMEPGAVIQGRVVGLPEGTRVRVQASAATQGGGSAEGLMGVIQEATAMMGDLGIGMGEKSVTPGADGTFALRGLRVGRGYRVWLSQQGRGFAAAATCSPRLELTAPTSNVELRYDPGITVTLQLIDARSKAPVERLWVRQQLRGGEDGGLGDLMGMAANFGRGGAGRAREYPEGRVTIPNLRPRPGQKLSLDIDALGYRPFARADVALPAAGTLDLGPVALEPLPMLTVAVVDGRSGAPVQGASVRLQGKDAGGGGRNPFAALADGGVPDLGGMDLSAIPGMGDRLGGGPASGRTDDEGHCVLNSRPGEAVVLTVDSDQHARFEQELTLPAGNLEQKVTLLQGGRVEVTVVDADGAPLARANVEALPPSGRRARRGADENGVAVFERLTPGEHRFRLAERGRGADVMAAAAEIGAAVGQQYAGGRPAAAADGQVVAVRDGETVQLRLQKDPTVRLRGVVMENGAPLGGAQVTFQEGPGQGDGDAAREGMAAAMAAFGGRGRSARAGDDGRYQLPEVKAGQHRLRISHDGLAMPVTVAVTLGPGENVFDVHLTSQVLRGMVKGPDGAGVAGASVRVGRARPDGGANDPLRAARRTVPGMDFSQMLGGGSAVQTGADGRFELRGVPAGVPLQVSAEAKGFADAVSATVEVAAGQVRDGVDVVLGQAGRIQVTAAKVAPFSFVRAVALGADGEPDKTVPEVNQLMRRGGVTLDGLRPGRWRVTLGAPRRGGGEGAAPQEVTVVAGQAVTVAF